MLVISLLLAAAAGAVSVARPVPVRRVFMQPVAALNAPAQTPAPPAAPLPSLAPDREAALIAKLAAKLPSQDAVARMKTAAWIGDLALEHPRAAVQAAAVGALAADAEASGSLTHFEALASQIAAVAAATPFDAVFEDAVGRLVDAARRAGRAQRVSALAVAENLGRSATPARREAAAALIESLRDDPALRSQADELTRAAARVRAGR